MGLKVIEQAVCDLLATDVVVEQVATGFLWAEGPLWHRDGGYLLFSDVAGDGIHRWSAAHEVQEFRRPSGKANGLTFDAQGRLIVCEHIGRRVTRTSADGTSEVLASAYMGQPLNGPNDVVVASDGAIYFSDPTGGLLEFFGIERPQDLSFQGVFRIAPDGALQLLVDDFEIPNGLCFSPDESLLYIDDTAHAHIRVFDVQADGSLSRGRVFFDFQAAGGGDLEGMADGMKIDERGNLYATGPGGVWIIAPDGTPLGRIELPEEPSNLAWGGADWRTLYITARTSVYRVPTLVAGNHVTHMK